MRTVIDPAQHEADFINAGAAEAVSAIRSKLCMRDCSVDYEHARRDLLCGAIHIKGLDCKAMIRVVVDNERNLSYSLVTECEGATTFFNARNTPLRALRDLKHEHFH